MHTREPDRKLDMLATHTDLESKLQISQVAEGLGGSP